MKLKLPVIKIKNSSKRTGTDERNSQGCNPEKQRFETSKEF